MGDAPPYISVCSTAPGSVSVLYFGHVTGDSPRSPESPAGTLNLPASRPIASGSRKVAHAQVRASSRRAHTSGANDNNAHRINTRTLRLKYTRALSQNQANNEEDQLSSNPPSPFTESDSAEEQRMPLPSHAITIYLDNDIWNHVSLHAYPDATLAIVTNLEPGEYAISASIGSIHICSAEKQERDALVAELQVAEKASHDSKAQMDRAIYTMQRSIERQAAANSRSRDRAYGLRDRVNVLHMQKTEIDQEQVELESRAEKFAQQAGLHRQTIETLEKAIKEAESRIRQNKAYSVQVASQLAEATAAANAAENDLASIMDEIRALSLVSNSMRPWSVQRSASMPHDSFRFPLAPRP